VKNITLLAKCIEMLKLIRKNPNSRKQGEKEDVIKQLSFM
jgi:hypothetical protein